MSSLCIACFNPHGMESRKITDGQIKASTEFNPAHGTTNGRLNFKAGGGKTGAWSARTNDVHQWLQVDLGAKAEVTGDTDPGTTRSGSMGYELYYLLQQRRHHLYILSEQQGMEKNEIVARET